MLKKFMKKSIIIKTLAIVCVAAVMGVVCNKNFVKSKADRFKGTFKLNTYLGVGDFGLVKISSQKIDSKINWDIDDVK